MGGGDLNLKKSWHPTTLRNMERVWKAEQKHEAETRKIEELQKELQQERDREEIRHYAEEKGVVKKKADRLDWMYEGPASHVNREEYLLGRTVDKTFELLQQAETAGTSGGDFQTEGDVVPESILKKPAKGGNVTIDLANKIREDPLLVIKKQEDHNRKELLENPVRMKQLREMLLKIKGGKNEKKSKKNKRSKKKLRSDTSPEESSEEESRIKRHHKRDKVLTVRRKEKRRGSSSDSSDDKKYHRHQSSDSLSRSRRSKQTEERPQKMYRNDSGLAMPTIANSNPRQDRYEPRIKRQQGTRSPERSRTFQKPSKLNAAEREKRLKEMISNAEWRDQQRDTNMKRHLDEVKREEELLVKTGKVDIMTPMLSKAANISTVESRIKSNIYKIQRTKADLERSFTKR